MERYANLSGNSGVFAFGIEAESITVQFKSGRHRFYLYTYRTPGMPRVEEMKRLARAGRGLNAYIRSAVGEDYENRW